MDTESFSPSERMRAALDRYDIAIRTMPQGRTILEELERDIERVEATERKLIEDRNRLEYVAREFPYKVASRVGTPVRTSVDSLPPIGQRYYQQPLRRTFGGTKISRRSKPKPA